MPDLYDGTNRRGPYGTNEGDIWTMEGSPVGDRLAADGLIGIHEMMVVDNELQERIYSVELDNPDPEMQELIARARRGNQEWIAARASEN